jgi:methyl-accepting chemotaxis protein
MFVIASIGTTIWLGFHFSHDQRTQSVRAQLEFRTTELAERLNARLAQEIRGLTNLAKNKLAAGPKKETGDTLALYSSISDFFERVSVIDAQGKVVASSTYDQSEYEDFSGEGWFKQVIRDGSIAKSSAIGAEVKNALLTVAIPVQSVRANGPGLIAGQVSIKKLESLLQSESRHSEKVQIFTEPFLSKPNQAGFSSELFGALARRAAGAHQDGTGLWGYSPVGAVTNLEWMMLVSAPATAASLPLWNWGVIAGTCLATLLFFLFSNSSVIAGYRSRFDRVLEEVQSMEEAAHRQQDTTFRHMENITSCTKKVQQLGVPFQSIQSTHQEISPVLGMIEKAASGMQISAEQARVVLEGLSASLEEIPSLEAALFMGAPGNHLAPAHTPPDLRPLEEWIEQIKGKARAFHDFAFQTKLLSFNAAVEADRMGDGGKGVLIVAEELASLSRMSAQSAKELVRSLEGAPRRIEEALTPAPVVAQAAVQPAPLAHTRLGQMIDTQRGSVKRLQDAVRTILESAAIAGEASHELHARREDQGQVLSQLHQIIEDLDQRSRQTLSEFTRAPSGIESFGHSLENIRELASESEDREPTTTEQTSPQSVALPGTPPPAPPLRARPPVAPVRKKPVREQPVSSALPHARKSAAKTPVRRTG